MAGNLYAKTCSNPFFTLVTIPKSFVFLKIDLMHLQKRAEIFSQSISSTDITNMLLLDLKVYQSIQELMNKIIDDAMGYKMFTHPFIHACPEIPFINLYI